MDLRRPGAAGAAMIDVRADLFPDSSKRKYPQLLVVRYLISTYRMSPSPEFSARLPSLNTIDVEYRGKRAPILPREVGRKLIRQNVDWIDDFSSTHQI